MQEVRELMNRWCKLELDIVDTYRKTIEVYRNSNLSGDDFVKVSNARKLCHKILDAIYNNS